MKLLCWEHYWTQLLREKAHNLDGKISVRTRKKLVWDDHFYFELREMLITDRLKQRPLGKRFLPKELEKHVLMQETQKVK